MGFRPGLGPSHACSFCPSIAFLVTRTKEHSVAYLYPMVYQLSTMNALFRLDPEAVKFGQQRSGSSTDLWEAWTAGQTSGGLIVAILSSHIDPHHPPYTVYLLGHNCSHRHEAVGFSVFFFTTTWNYSPCNIVVLHNHIELQPLYIFLLVFTTT